MKGILVLWLALLSAGVAVAQDSSYARRIVCALSSEEMFGRGMQNRGDSIAADYLRREMIANGVKPLGDD